jgi:hypothetical protein
LLLPPRSLNRSRVARTPTSKALKAEFQAQLHRLAKRVDTLETENAQLKREAKAAPATAASPAVAALQRRVTELELTADKPSAEAKEAAKRSTANAEAIKAMELSLQSDETETRDIFREDGGWPFDVTKLYDLARPLEFGVDWAKSEPMGTDGHLWKITLAPQISRSGKFFSRPVIRPFITYAKWSDGFKGLVGGTAYDLVLEKGWLTREKLDDFLKPENMTNPRRPS